MTNQEQIKYNKSTKILKDLKRNDPKKMSAFTRKAWEKEIEFHSNIILELCFGPK